MLLIHTHLDVEAYIRPAVSASRHHAAIGIGEGNLGLATFIESLLQFFGLIPHALHLVDFLLQFFCCELLLLRFFFVGFIHLVQVAVDIFIQLLDGLPELLFAEIFSSAVDGFELTAVDGNQVATEELEFFCRIW